MHQFKVLRRRSNKYRRILKNENFLKHAPESAKLRIMDALERCEQIRKELREEYFLRRGATSISERE